MNLAKLSEKETPMELSIQRQLIKNLNILGSLQKLGKALMLPIAVLPVAGLLLRFGSPDLLDIEFIKEAGAAIFANIALIFSIGVAVGISKDNAGSAALAGGIGYLVLSSAMKAIDPSLDMGVLAGIIAGLVGGLAYNRFYNLKLPDWLAFFGGKRSVPIVTAGIVTILALIFGMIWPYFQKGLNQAGNWMADSGVIGAFVYGTLNRLLIPTGLHQVINSFVWFIFGEFEGATGDLGRFFAGDPNAGTYMAGFYPVMIFGLPAACLAMYRCARPENKKAAGGILLGVGLTSLVTGVTEPVEFLFMFLAPGLFLIHAILTGLSLAVCSILGIKAGFTFSAGAIDFILNYPLASNTIYLLPVSILWFALYYGLFVFFIRRFNLKTPGREEQSLATNKNSSSSSIDLPNNIKSYFSALGGVDNIVEIDSCITRLRLSVKDSSLANETALKSLGAKGVIPLGSRNLQVILGPQAEHICREMQAYAKSQTQGKEQEKESFFEICSPASGKLLPLESVPDEVFASKLAGDGLAIMVEGEQILAPCAGTITRIYSSNHAFAIACDHGIELLVHVGIDTVSLKGKGFSRLAQEGQKVQAGDPILALDLVYLKEHAKSLATPVLVINSEDFPIVWKNSASTTSAGESLLKISTFHSQRNQAHG